MKKVLVSALGALSISVAAGVCAADRPPDPASPGTELRGESSVHAYRSKDGCGTTISKTVRFTPTRTSVAGKDVNLILRETIEQHDQDCHEGVDGKITVDAIAYDDDYKAGKSIWSLSTQGWAADIYTDAGDFYRVFMPGCCGSSDTYVYFSLENGKHLLDATGPLMKVQLSEGDYVAGNRSVAVMDNASSLAQRFADDAGTKDAIAVVYMGLGEEAAESIVVHRTSDDECNLNEIVLIVDGKEQPGDSVLKVRFLSPDSGIFIRGKLDCVNDTGELTFDVPIMEGHLSAVGAKSSDAKVKFSAGKPVKQ